MPADLSMLQLAVSACCEVLGGMCHMHDDLGCASHISLFLLKLGSWRLANLLA